MKNKFTKTFARLFIAFGLLTGVAPSLSQSIDLFGPAPVEFSNNYKGQYLGEVGNPDTPEGETTPDGGEEVTPPDANPEEPLLKGVPTKLTIHYQMDPPIDYTAKRFYLWAGAIDGETYETTGIDDFGMYVTVNPQKFGPHDTFYFIIKNDGTWAGQSTDTLIEYKEFPPDENGELEVWCINGEPGVIDVFATLEETQGGKITYAKFTDWKNIHVEGTVDVASYKLYAFNKQYFLYNPDDQLQRLESFVIYEGGEQPAEFDIVLPRFAPTNLIFKVKVTFTDGRTKQSFVSMENLYYTPRFEKFYTYQGNDLGATYSKDKTTFKLWAPTCGHVELRVYNKGTPVYLDTAKGSDYFQYYLMEYTKGGVWSCEVPGDLDGKYYTYYVHNTNGANEVIDPYAKSAGINGIRGMVLDFDKTDPEGWDEIPLVWDKQEGFDLKQPNDLSVYEVHVRDLTMDDTWGGKEKAGTFNAFAEKGTKYTEGETTVTTGFDHIEELGFNAVQILPFFDASNSEVDTDLTNNKMDIEFNWGYNPLNYNVVEGAYSSNPYDGAVRVTELKQLVQALATNKNHTRIIMDVVYNHVASVSSNVFTKLMPKYYFRMTKDGYYADGAGCGNEVKTEATMMRKFIVDSVTWWATEYKIKGFRFDLMGLIDTETMRLVKDAVYAIDPDNVCYGEGWALGYNGAEGTKGTYSAEVFNTLAPTKDSPGILGGFSDAFRNGIRGANDQGFGTNNPLPGWGLISQGASDVGEKSKDVAEGMLGNFTWCGGTNPYQTVNYASCHDNWTLYDQLHWTLSDDGGVTEPEFATVAEGVLAVESAVAFSNGIAFFQSGEELFRTKIDREPVKEGEISYVKEMYGVPVSHNSYTSSDETNALRYDQKIKVTYKGEVIPTNHYYQKYCEMIHKRNAMEYRLQPGQTSGEGKLGNAWYANDNPNGSTGFAIYLGFKDYSYYIFFSGRVATSFGFGDFDNCVELYNSLGEGKGYMMGIKLEMSPRQCLVLKKVNA